MPRLKTTSLTLKTLVTGVLLLLSFSLRAQLVINEVSQGPSGSKEYVELVVTGTPTCAGVPCVDLRGWYIDDNNGIHATGAGTGIAPGCIRFTNNALWSCVPAGTLIVIYNDGDLNASVPANDFSTTDGNCRLVIPISNCLYIEKNTSQPSTATAVYPVSGFTTCGSWTYISMANSDDSFQTLNPAGGLVHSVSWGNNTLAPIIYFSGGAGGMVIWNSNAVNTNPALQGNWVRTAVAGNETPGAPNNAANAAWIASMNNNCSVIVPLSVTTSFTNASCTCTGSATVTASGGTAPYTYAWTPSGGNGATASNLCAGAYTCTITDAIGCTQTANFNITSVSTMSLSGASVNVSCNGGCNGSATVTVVSGSGPFTYAWAPSGGNAVSASGLCPGNYTCTVTGAGGCTGTQSFSITQPAALSASISSGNVSCFGGNNGTATVSASGGSPSYTYAWSPSGGNAATASSLTQGSYTCTITDANSCSTTQSIVITQAPALTATSTQTNPLCNGGTGSATVSPSGGSPTYTYAWSPSGGNAATASGLAAGNYSCLITDVNGCTLSETFSITQPTALNVASSQQNISCNGGSNGHGTVFVSGGTPGYSYAWTPSGGNAATSLPLPAGNYTCTITDANGCSATSAFPLTQPTALTNTSSQTNVSCNGGSNATATVTASGGTPGYTYAWSPSGGNAATASSLAQGNYTCIITDANGCTHSASFSITQPAALSFTSTQSNVSCNGGNTGAASVSVSGGTPAYTYAWTPSGGNSASASSLTQGNYTCTITDANNCTSSASFVITQPTALSTSISTNPSTCSGSNGSATVSTSGGTPGYTYSWSPSGGNAATANNLAAGNYTVTVTDANNCSTTQTATVTNLAAPTLSLASSSNISCFGGNDGAASISVSGGTGPFTYAWSPSGGTGPAASSLSAGNYTVTVTDANLCTSTQSLTLTQAPALTSTNTVTGISCFGAGNGTATVNVTGGTPGYTYAWAPSGGTSSSASSLAAGNYTCTVTDANGCSATSSLSITEPAALTASAGFTDALCNGAATGTATVSTSGGTGTYSYNWLPSGGNAATANNLAAGNYSCTVTDQNNCSLTQTVSISEPPALSTVVSSTASNCGHPDGTMNVVASGGTGAYTYNWSPGAYTSANVNAVTTGNYSVVVTDANGCTLTSTVNVANTPGVVAALASQNNVSCFGQSDASVFITQSGGNPAYTYAWSPAISTADSAVNIAAGTYSVTVSDANACTSTLTITITEPPQLTLNATANPAGVCSGSPVQLTATPAGGTPVYTVTWNPGNLNGSVQTFTPTSSGTYTATVADQNGCTASSAPVNVVLFPSPTANFAADLLTGCAPLCVNFADASVITPPAGIASWEWDFGDGNTSTAQNPNHCYQSTGNYTVSLAVISNTGCLGTFNIPAYISVLPTPVADFTANPQPASILDPQISFTDASVNADSWTWNFGDVLNSSSSLQNPSFIYTEPTCYQVTLTVSNSSGCTANTTQEVCIDPTVTVYVPNAFTPNGDGNNDYFMPKGEGLTDADYQLLIFDRWGNQIFESRTMSDGWDGRAKGHSEVAQTDTYVWKLNVRDVKGEEHYLIGHVNLLR